MSLGDFATSALVDLFFTTRYGSVPTALVGGVVSVYKANSTTQTTTGVTLTADFDGVTGLNHVRIDLSADLTFYAAGTSCRAVLTAGTVGGQAVAGTVIDDFSVQARYTPTVNPDAIVDAVWDEAESGHISAGTFGRYLDARVSQVGAGAGGGGHLVIT